MTGDCPRRQCLSSPHLRLSARKSGNCFVSASSDRTTRQHPCRSYEEESCPHRRIRALDSPTHGPYHRLMRPGRAAPPPMPPPPPCRRHPPTANRRPPTASHRRTPTVAHRSRATDKPHTAGAAPGYGQMPPPPPGYGQAPYGSRYGDPELVISPGAGPTRLAGAGQRIGARFLDAVVLFVVLILSWLLSTCTRSRSPTRLRTPMAIEFRASTQVCMGRAFSSTRRLLPLRLPAHRFPRRHARHEDGRHQGCCATSGGARRLRPGCDSACFSRSRHSPLRDRLPHHRVVVPLGRGKHGRAGTTKQPTSTSCESTA